VLVFDTLSILYGTKSAKTLGMAISYEGLPRCDQDIQSSTSVDNTGQTSLNRSEAGCQYTWKQHMNLCSLRSSIYVSMIYCLMLLSRDHFLICFKLLMMKMPMPLALSVGFIIQTLDGALRNSFINTLLTFRK
jgi:hypothetical protein